jgi:hypothetical protein
LLAYAAVLLAYWKLRFISLRLSNRLKRGFQPFNFRETQESITMKSTFFERLEQSVFFASSKEDENPISFDLRFINDSLDEPSLNLSNSILFATNIHLPNILDETAFLNESVHRINEIIYVLAKNNLVEKVCLLLMIAF